MSEQLYTIPVNEAFDEDCECPVCKMYRELTKNSIEFTLGPSYMEDDVRMETDRIGFCAEHVKELYHHQNRLGLALITKTHMDRVILEVEDKAGKKAAPVSLFQKKPENPLLSYLREMNRSCYICNRINRIFNRYLVTVFYLYEKDSSFREKFDHCKGFCTEHYALLLSEAERELSGSVQREFRDALNKSFLDHMKRVRDDLDWFIDKFDYRNADAPWKNSQDALPRALLKTNGVEVQPPKK